MKLLLALAGAGVVLTAAPAVARHPHMYRTHNVCMRWHHHRCTMWKTGVNTMGMRHPGRYAAYRVGYRFAPTYAYTPYSSLPQPYVTRYSLDPNYRYVYTNNYIYQVDPTTYAVRRVIDALVR